MAKGSRSFDAAARVFDPATRDAARHFYAWCRHCDDVIDGQVAGHGSVASARARAERLALLEGQTRDAMAGRPCADPAFAALARIAVEHRLPAIVPLDILAGFRMDVEQRSYATLDDLLDYCYGVAGAVGIGMAVLLKVDPNDRETLDRACDLGLAFQMTNIARDVMDDARSGRVYLPAAFFGRDRVAPAFILDSANADVVRAAALRLLDAAERYYASAWIGIARLPWRSAWAIAAALGIYRDIGQRVRRADDPWAIRLSVPARAKLWHVAAGGVRALTVRRSARNAPQREGLWTRPADFGLGA